MDASKTYVYIFDNYVAQLVDGLDADVHKHGAYQLSLSVDGRPHLVGPSKHAQRVAMGHLSGPNTPHALNSCSGQQLLFWVAPQSTLGRHLGARYLDATGFGIVPDDVVDRVGAVGLRPAIAEGWSAPELARACDQVLAAMVDEPWADSADLHPAIRDAVAIIQSQPQFSVAADDLAERVALSTSRFLHLFREQMGTPLRPYLRWLRLTDALRRVAVGESITDAAASAGFSDAPHLNRSAQEYFGLRPSDFAAHPDITVEVCVSGAPV